MGLFDLPAPLLSWLDQRLDAVAPPLVRVVIWAALSAALSMGLYRRLSRQRLLAAVAAELRETRRELASYDGDFRGLRPRLGRLLGLSLRQVRLTFLPAVVASVPLLFVLPWLGKTMNHRLPEAGTVIAVRVQPPRARVAWQPPAARHLGDGRFRVAWPDPRERLVLSTANGRALLELPLPAPSPVIEPPHWSDRLIGNPAGYLPAGTPVKRVELGLPSRTFLPFGPRALQSAEALYLAVLVLCSLVIRRAFGIR